MLVRQTITFIRVVNNLYILTLIFFESEIVFEISVSDKEIESSITEDSFNIVIDTILLVLDSERQYNRLI